MCTMMRTPKKREAQKKRRRKGEGGAERSLGFEVRVQGLRASGHLGGEEKGSVEQPVVAVQGCEEVLALQVQLPQRLRICAALEMIIFPQSSSFLQCSRLMAHGLGSRV